jgi:hypothetical protein
MTTSRPTGSDRQRQLVAASRIAVPGVKTATNRRWAGAAGILYVDTMARARATVRLARRR